MKVICPKCQFENQSSSSQVFCARCATMIDIRSARESLSGTDPGPAGMAGNIGRPNSRLPYSGRPEPGGATGSLADDAPFQANVQLPPARERDAYATRVGDDFDDLLDIPPVRPARSRSETAPILDQTIFEAEPVSPPPPYPFGGAWQSEQDGGGDSGTGFGHGVEPPPIRGGARETRDFNAEGDSSNLMGWPVLTENSSMDDEDYAEDNSNRQGMAMRLILGAAVFAGLIGGAYFFLGDLISKRQDQAETLQVEGQGLPATTAGTGVAEPTPAATVTPTPAAQDLSTLPAAGADPLLAGGGSQLVDIPPVTGQGVAGQVPPSQVAAPAPRPESGPGQIPATGDWTIQIASFSDQTQAGARVASLKADGLPARVARGDIPGKGTWYRVQIGGFKSREEGQRYGNQLRSRGAIQDFIVTPTSR